MIQIIFHLNTNLPGYVKNNLYSAKKALSFSKTKTSIKSPKSKFFKNIFLVYYY